MTAVAAKLSRDRKRVECGSCGRTLCIRLRMPSGKFRLQWDSSWEKKGDHIERYGWDRLEDGRPPTRRGFSRNIGLSEPVKVPKAFPLEVPALCRCEALNELDRKRLDVIQIHGYG